MQTAAVVADAVHHGCVAEGQMTARRRLGRYAHDPAAPPLAPCSSLAAIIPSMQLTEQFAQTHQLRLVSLSLLIPTYIKLIL